MSRNALIGFAALAVACGGKDTAETAGPTCTNGVELYPAADSTGVYYRTTVEALFDDVEDSATLTVDGVTGSSEWVGNSLVFTPDAPLASNTSYTATVTYSCGTGTASWTTSEIGSSIDVGSLAGNSYNLDLTSGRFVQPPDVGELLGSYLGEVTILVGVAEASASNITMVGAIGVEGAVPPAQDTCEPTIDFPVADFTENPFFSVGPDTTTFTVSDVSVTIENLLVSGAFSPAGDYVDGGVLAGKIDTRPLVPLLDEEGDDNAICEITNSLQIPCEPCPDGEPYCLTLYVDSIVMLGLDATVEQISEDTICDRPECAAECKGK
jgi:hypothetical protein